MTLVFTIQQVSIRGTPDLLICRNGKFVALELKRNEDGVVSKLQQYNIDLIGKAGGYAMVCMPENFDEIFEEIRRM